MKKKKIILLSIICVLSVLCPIHNVEADEVHINNQGKSNLCFHWMGQRVYGITDTWFKQMLLQKVLSMFWYVFRLCRSIFSTIWNK